MRNWGHTWATLGRFARTEPDGGRKWLMAYAPTGAKGIYIYKQKVGTARDWPCKIHMNARPQSYWKGAGVKFNWGRI